MSSSDISKEPHIAVGMMVKNEKKRLHVTLNSIKEIADSLILYDTGSEDNTIEIARTFCTKHNIPFRLKTGTFVDFATSRNVLLDFADSFTDVDYILLLDTNDELQGWEKLRLYCREFLNKPNTGFLLCQQWLAGGSITKYFNVRMVKAREKWSYKGKVHEYISSDKYPSEKIAHQHGDVVIQIDDGVVLFQDRNQDDDKTGKRFTRDKELLLEAYHENPSEPRTLFYLAQTCSCLNQHQESYYYYKLRTLVDGFWEEKFHALMSCGNLSVKFGHPWEVSMGWYLKAYETFSRAEPLIKIAYHYKDKNWLLCFTFADLACKLDYPECILFVDKIVYDYSRWQLLGLAGWYSKNYERGKIGCLNALKSEHSQELDRQNLMYYLKREKEIQTENNQKNKQ